MSLDPFIDATCRGVLSRFLSCSLISFATSGFFRSIFTTSVWPLAAAFVNGVFPVSVLMAKIEQSCSLIWVAR